MKTNPPYRIESRHQDSSWEYVGEWSLTLPAARRVAKEMAETPHAYGMTRVVEAATGRVLVTFAGGGGESP